MKNLSTGFHFEITAKQGQARAGIFHTPHGVIRTPIFAPVGTQANVKALTPQQVEEIGASLILANTYHLYLRPGDNIIAEMGGLHSFMNWQQPILTDSGGFQVFSLAVNRSIDHSGVTFKSHIDGSTHFLSPEKAIAIQENLGADIIMAFDECASPYNREYVNEAMERTHDWALRCIDTKTRTDQALFGIVQGGIFPDLREKSARFISKLGLPGNAIGGLSVGETKDEMHQMLDVVNQVLPEDKPRYLMGVGTPEDLVNGVLRGVDIFDCVLPTRLGRNGAALSKEGRMNLRNARYARDPRPIVDQCECYTCRNFGRAYLRHLTRSNEILGHHLISLHNVHYLVNLARKMREAIIAGEFKGFADGFLNRYRHVDL